MRDDIRRWVAVATLAAFAGAETWTAVQWRGMRELQLVFLICGAALFAAGVGVYFRQMWARWIGLAAGLAGLCNALVFCAWFGAWTAECLFYVTVSVVVLGALGGNRMARHFETSLRPGSVFRREGFRVSLLGAAVVTGIAAIPTLLIVGALPSAVVVALGALGTWRERAAGVMLLGLGGVSAAGIALFGGFGTEGMLPVLGLAGICGVAANVGLARPALRYLQRAA